MSLLGGQRFEDAVVDAEGDHHEALPVDVLRVLHVDVADDVDVVGHGTELLESCELNQGNFKQNLYSSSHRRTRV